MYNKNPVLFLFCMLTIFLCGSIIFLIGFFPASQVKLQENHEELKANLAELRTNLDGHILVPPAQRHPRIVLMIVDALRVDFVSEDKMPYAYNTACNELSLHVDIPTVTMPRLKSMTTGVLSNFIDILLNLGHRSALNDSIIHGLARRGDVMAFAGDHTWMELFPKVFKRAAANNDSFFVTDFFDGDKSVTKTLKHELMQRDWSLLVLHYLGLDHIGHVEGTESLNIPAKLKEMDESVKLIMNGTQDDEFFLLLTGDHGMRNGGGHGGNSPEETTVPLYVYHKGCEKKLTNKKLYNQIDLAPTLAIIFAIDIPKHSIGCLIPELLADFTLEEQLYAYHYNAEHLLQQAINRLGKGYVQRSDFLQWFNDAKKSHAHFLNTKRSSEGTSSYLFERAKLEYIRMSNEVSQMLAESLISFEYTLIALGLGLTVGTASYTLILVLFADTRTHRSNKKLSIFLALLMAVVVEVAAYYMDYIETESLFFMVLLIPPLAAAIFVATKVLYLLMHLLLPQSKNKGMHLSMTLPLPYLAGFIFHTCSLGSSSYIEEEHLSWYYLGATMLMVTIALTLHKKIQRLISTTKLERITETIAMEFVEMRIPFFMLGFIAIIRHLNQTGDKWAHLADIEDFLNGREHKTSLTLIFLFGLYNLVLSMRTWLTKLQFIAAALAVIFVYMFRGFSGVVHMPTIANLSNLMLFGFWLCIALVAAVPYKHLLMKSRSYGYEPKSNLVHLLQTNLCCSLLIAALLHKPHNVVLLPGLLFVLEVSYKLCDSYLQYCGSTSDKSYSLIQKTVLTIFIAKMFYFYQGNSNALSKIDLTPGYIGQSTYQPIIVGIFVTLNTYCAPINAFLFLFVHMFGKRSESLPQRQEKEQFSNWYLVQNTEQDINLVISLYTAFTMLPVAFYLCLLVAMRYHLFIYSVFAPKAFYECFSVLVFYLNFIFMTFYLKLFKCSI